MRRSISICPTPINQISDLSPLANLQALTLLRLSGNQITDLSVLVDNTGIGSGDTVYVDKNPLSEYAIVGQIPALEARGVRVIQ